MRDQVKTVLAHRYLYYIETQPVISDFEYDALERQLTYEEKEEIGVGSSLADSYSEEIIALARTFGGIYE